MSTDPEQIHAAQAIYTPRTLAAYDTIVLGFSNRLLWKCPTQRLLDHYNDHVSANHLDVGVGSGFFPDRCRFPTATPRLGLLDLNRDALDYASSRVKRFAPEVYQANVLEPIELDCERFDSIAVNYVLHCLPGTLDTKIVALDHLRALLHPGGTLFGATLFGRDVPQNWAAKRLTRFYNSKGVFCNLNDTPEAFQNAMESRFDSFKIEIIGSVGLFSAENR